MASETLLRPGELKEVLLKEIASADLAAAQDAEVGTVLEVRDGVARIYGLKSAMSYEMLEITAQTTGETVIGLVLNLEEDSVGAAVIGDYLKLKEGDEVRRTGRLLEVPAGPSSSAVSWTRSAPRWMGSGRSRPRYAGPWRSSRRASSSGSR
jgi:F-type H+-transporting ATPase subunit alpha